MITEISTTERHNAMISYCFLAPFMLLSREERFSNDFVRMHARYATLLEVAFLGLIITLIRSRNFSSIIIFGASWVHIVLFVGFFILLGLLIMGIYAAMRGQDPKIGLKNLSGFSLKNMGEKAHIDADQKTPLLASHIPFLGTYLSHKYGNFLISGEKFGNWAFILAALLMWVDPSLTLVIGWIILATFWVVYQSIIVASGGDIQLMGTKLPGSGQCHIFLRSVLSYTKHLISHKETLPHWANIQAEESQKYESRIFNDNKKLSIPIINIPLVIRTLTKEPLSEDIINALLVDILVVLLFFFWYAPIVMVFSVALWGCYWHEKESMPVVSEISTVILKIIHVIKNKSVSEKIHISSHQ